MHWKEWLKALLGLAILLGIFEMLLPSGKLARFSKLILGLVLMLAVLQPISTLLNPTPFGAELPLTDAVWPAADVLNSAELVRWAGVKSILLSDQGGLVREIEALLLAEEELQAVQVDVDGSPCSKAALVVYVEPWNRETEAKVKKILGGVLNLGERQVDVRELVK